MSKYFGIPTIALNRLHGSMVFLFFMAACLLTPQVSAGQIVTLQVAWNYDGSSADLAGFRLYSDDESVCETSDPDLRSMPCEVAVRGQMMPFSLTSYDIYGGESDASEVFWVDFSSVLTDNSSPVAMLEASAFEGQAPLLVSLDGSNSVDPDGNVASYDWSFGDGESAEGARVDHTFYTPGEYVINLTVTDDVGATAETELLVSVLDYGQSAGDSDDDVDPLQAIIFPGATIVGGGCSVNPYPAAPGEAGSWLLLLLAGTLFAIVKQNK